VKDCACAFTDLHKTRPVEHIGMHNFDGQAINACRVLVHKRPHPAALPSSARTKFAPMCPEAPVTTTGR